ncbi:hypothetical protein QUF90_13255 [Desulfococcaceae bacterium HSG9]|nr:hypothetical protein [Desulfococcaceae bacterium HSG9]
MMREIVNSRITSHTSRFMLHVSRITFYFNETHTSEIKLAPYLAKMMRRLFPLKEEQNDSDNNVENGIRIAIYQ